jgi:hypothetical protein
MKEQSLSQIVDEIISELPLNDRVSIAHMNKNDAAVLQSVFELYIRSKVGAEFDDQEFNNVMNELWKRLRDTHRLRVVKK